MKNFQSTAEGFWIEQVAIQLTEAEKQLMVSQKEEDAQEKEVLFNRIKEEREQPTTLEKSDALTAFYTGIKPQLKETNVYQLISCDYCEKDENSYSGILNYRLNEDHQQLRFNSTLI
jgi:SAM-dependent MidA family methyltransferase